MVIRQPHRDLIGRSPSDSKFPVLPKIINGSIAGIVGTIGLFPLDLVKVRIQNQVVGPDGERLYTSLTDGLRKIYRAEGVRGLYRGCLVTSLLVAPEKSMKLVSNDYFRYLFKPPDKPLSLSSEILAGGLAGVCQNIFTTPMELLKIALQDAGRLSAESKDKCVNNHRRAREVAAEVVRKHGFLGLYRGMEASMLRNIFFSVVYFPIFFNLDSLGPRKGNNPAEAVHWWSFIAGCTAGLIGAAAATPLDVVKTRMQRLKLGPGEVRYSGTLDALTKIARTEGPMALMRGALIRMIVIAPGFGIFQLIYFLGVGQSIVAMIEGGK